MSEPTQEIAACLSQIKPENLSSAMTLLDNNNPNTETPKTMNLSNLICDLVIKRGVTQFVNGLSPLAISMALGSFELGPKDRLDDFIYNTGVIKFLGEFCKDDLLEEFCKTMGLEFWDDARSDLCDEIMLRGMEDWLKSFPIDLLQNWCKDLGITLLENDDLVDKAMVKIFKLKPLDEEPNQCPICLQEVYLYSPIERKQLPCGHELHFSCGQELVSHAIEKVSNVEDATIPCPICRKHYHFVDLENILF